ncbi:MAG: SMC-Scp complex subunit ScpB, partial [Gemmatimonadota bacterium]
RRGDRDPPVFDTDEHAIRSGFDANIDVAADAQGRKRMLPEKPPRYSRAVLETLAIIAYRQPIGRAEIEEIRGVNVGGVLKSLHERGLIDVTGRGEGIGRPLLYATTPLFLEHFALRHLEELPRADELAVALRAEPKPI